uniref:G-protein coupled receptors family 1 profile domain-containing protein n=1 Tax=Moschus moschiferus TaxID=68415 RepID=A0A8C6DRD3_MOSMO
MNVAEFILMGLTQNPQMQRVLFWGLLITYIVTVTGNLFIVVNIICSQTLDSPIYFFLAFLSFIDAWYSSSIIPKMLADLLSESKSISFSACMIQFFNEHFLGATEIVLLVVMAFDHYVAIYRPLNYVTIMDHHTCCLLLLMVVAWIGGILHATVQMLFTVDLTFCGPNIINHFMCDFFSLLEIACSNTYRLGMVVATNSGGMCLLIFFLLLVSYTVILSSLKSRGSEGRRKALSTCGAHFAVVVLYFIPCIFTYTRPVISYPEDKLVSVFFAILTPMLNPIIYTVRNKEVKNAVRSLLKRRNIDRKKRL